MSAPSSANGAASVAPAAATAAAPPASRPYNPNAALSQLDALALPDESSNAVLTTQLSEQVATLIATKQDNERREQQVGATLASKVKLMESEQRKLNLIRSELLKLDHSLSRNIDMLRAEIESVGRECNTLQKDFEWKEAEYMSCRKSLAKAKQRKLMLTSHLDHIILSNENAKAIKLAELERELGLAPSTPTPPLALPVPPAAVAAVASPNGTAAARSNGPSAAALKASAESTARHEAALAAAHVPADHPGLRLDAVAPPGFAGFDEPQQYQMPPQTFSQHSSSPRAPAPVHSAPAPVPSSPVHRGPSPAAVATSRHVSVPPRSTVPAAPAPRPAATALSLAPKAAATPLSYAPDGTFAGFAD